MNVQSLIFCDLTQINIACFKYKIKIQTKWKMLFYLPLPHDRIAKYCKHVFNFVCIRLLHLVTVTCPYSKTVSSSAFMDCKRACTMVQEAHTKNIVIFIFCQNYHIQWSRTLLIIIIIAEYFSGSAYCYVSIYFRAYIIRIEVLCAKNAKKGVQGVSYLTHLTKKFHKCDYHRQSIS